jgi:hypothetical protein
VWRPHEDANAVLDWFDLPDPDGIDHFLDVDVGTVIGAAASRRAAGRLCVPRWELISSVSVLCGLWAWGVL